MEGQLLTVTVGDYMFGAPVSAVTEILANPQVTAIPRTPPVIAGVAVVRGQALTVLTIRPALNLPPAPVPMALRWGGHRGTSLIAVDRVDSLWTPNEPLAEDKWQGLVPPAIVELLTAGYRSGSEWLWAWAEDLPDRLQNSVMATA